MDNRIIEQLQSLSLKYLEQFKVFPYKNDPAAIFEYEYHNYLTPILEFIVPNLAKRLFEYPEEHIEFYLPYISERYHHNIKTEVSNILKNHDHLHKKKAKEIQNYFASEILKYSNQDKQIQQGFIIHFITTFLPPIIELSKSSPSVCINLLADLRNPRLQKNLLKHQEISKNLYTYINGQLIHQSWDTWIEKFFTYPRTKDMNEYFEKWIGRDKIHIKMCADIFDPSYYHQAKTWLKAKEKEAEFKRLQDSQR